MVVPAATARRGKADKPAGPVLAPQVLPVATAARGGAGTGGGGGAGGNSIGIAWLSASGPSVNGIVISADQSSPYLTVTAGAKGTAGPGGAGSGTALAGNPGAIGFANAVQQFH
jgi:hypothetical protein